MKYEKIFILGIIMLFSIVLVNSAQSTLGSKKFGACVNLPQTCADCTYNNVTKVINPNGEELINEEMSRVGTEYNYTYCNTSYYGDYMVHGKGDIGGEDTVWSYGFYITESGREKISSGESITLVISIVIILVIAILFLLISFKFESFVWKTIFIGVSSIIFLIAILYPLIILTQTFGGFSEFTARYTTFWFVMRILLGVVATFLFIYVAWVIIRLWKIKRGFVDVD